MKYIEIIMLHILTLMFSFGLLVSMYLGDLTGIIISLAMFLLDIYLIHEWYVKHKGGN